MKKTVDWLTHAGLVLLVTPLMLLVVASASVSAGVSIPAGSAPLLCANYTAPNVPIPKPLSTCTPDAKDDITIGAGRCGPVVYVDHSYTGTSGFRKITIRTGGSLIYPYYPGFELDASAIVIAGGKFEVGNAQCRIGSANLTDQATVRFTVPSTPFETKDVIEGITVENGGTLRLYGATGVAPSAPAPGANPQAPSWTYLAAPAGPPDLYGAASGSGIGNPVGANGADLFQVTDYVNWQVGQWIVVAGTDFSPDSAEFVQIYSATCSGPTTGPCTITLNQATPLVHYHFGGPAPDLGANAFTDDYSKNYGVDERAEVGLISRNVKLTSTPIPSNVPSWVASTSYSAGALVQAAINNNPFLFRAITAGVSGSSAPTWTSRTGTTVCDNGTGPNCSGGIVWENDGPDDDHIGGEIKILAGYKAVEIQGAELEKFGKDELGSYPIHFHHVGKAPTATTLIDSNSIHHSYNHCITLHDTDDVTISNNVCARIVDHMFYMESGNETGNTFLDNLGIGAMSNGFSITNGNPGALASFWTGDYLASQIDYDGFNITFSDHTSSVLGSSYTPSGFWITNPGSNTLIGNSIAGCQDQGRGFWMLPASTAIAMVPLPKGQFQIESRARLLYRI